MYKWWLGALPDGLVKDALEVALGESRALEVLLGLDLLCDCEGLLVGDWLHLLGPESVCGGLVLSEVELGTNQDDGYVWRVMFDLGIPL